MKLHQNSKVASWKTKQTQNNELKDAKNSIQLRIVELGDESLTMCNLFQFIHIHLTQVVQSVNTCDFQC